MSAGVASFVIGLVPMLTVVLSVIFLHERPKYVVYLGVFISLAGLMLMSIAEGMHASNGRGLLLILIAAWMGALYTVMQKRFLKRYHPVTVAAWVIWGGTLMLMIFFQDLWREFGMATMDATIAAVYMGIFPSAITYFAWSFVLSYLPASTASMYLYALPIVSTMMGFILLDEHPTIMSLGGGLLSLTGAVFATYRRHSFLPSVGRN